MSKTAVNVVALVTNNAHFSFMIQSPAAVSVLQRYLVNILGVHFNGNRFSALDHVT